MSFFGKLLSQPASQLYRWQIDCRAACHIALDFVGRIKLGAAAYRQEICRRTHRQWEFISEIRLSMLHCAAILSWVRRRSFSQWTEIQSKPLLSAFLLAIIFLFFVGNPFSVLFKDFDSFEKLGLCYRSCQYWAFEKRSHVIWNTTHKNQNHPLIFRLSSFMPANIYSISSNKKKKKANMRALPYSSTSHASKILFKDTK